MSSLHEKKIQKKKLVIIKKNIYIYMCMGEKAFGGRGEVKRPDP